MIFESREHLGEVSVLRCGEHLSCKFETRGRYQDLVAGEVFELRKCTTT